MKKFFIAVFSLLALLASCNDPNEGNDPQEKPTQEQLDSLLRSTLMKERAANCTIKNYETKTKEEMAESIFGPAGANGDEAVEEARLKFLERYAQLDDSLANSGDGNNSSTGEFVCINYEYESVDLSGKPITLSALMIFYGRKTEKGWRTNDISDIYLCCPDFYMHKDECATANDGGIEGIILQSTCSIIIIPDRVGFGASKDQELNILSQYQGRHNMHALINGLCLYQNEICDDMNDDYTISVVGVSQGAADAIMVHKYFDAPMDLDQETKEALRAEMRNNNMTETEIEDKINEYESNYTIGMLYNFKTSYVCCGPYYPEMIWEECFETGVVKSPYWIPIVLQSYLSMFNNAFPDEDLYSELYLEKKAGIDALLADRLFSADVFSYLLRSILAVGDEEIAPDPLPLDRLLNERALDKELGIFENVYSWFTMWNEIMYSDWTPRTKIHIYYSQKDELVPCAQSQKLMEFFGDKCIASEVEGNNHAECCREFWFTNIW